MSEFFFGSPSLEIIDLKGEGLLLAELLSVAGREDLGDLKAVYGVDASFMY